MVLSYSGLPAIKVKQVLPRSWNTAPPPLLRRARRTLSSSIRRVLHSFHGFCARPITTVSALRQRNRTRWVAGIWRKMHSSTARLNQDRKSQRLAGVTSTWQSSFSESSAYFITILSSRSLPLREPTCWRLTGTATAASGCACPGATYVPVPRQSPARAAASGAKYWWCYLPVWLRLAGCGCRVSDVNSRADHFCPEWVRRFVG